MPKEEFSVTFVNSNTLGGQTVPQFNIKFNPSEKQPFTDYDEMKKVIEYWLQNDGELP